MISACKYRLLSPKYRQNAPFCFLVSPICASIPRSDSAKSDANL